jgi:NADH-quinone oxidoreductase subunit M
MDVTIILLLLFFGAIATYFSGNKWASKVALLFGVASFIATIYILNLFNSGQNVGYFSQWINLPKIAFALNADGLSLLMLLLTTSLTPIIIYSSFGNEFKNAKDLYALVLFMAFAMCGTFLASDALLYYIFWELALIPIYFIALIWGNGDAESRKKAVVKFFIYTLAGSLFMLVAFIFLYQRAGSFLLGDLYKMRITIAEQSWVFLALFLAYAIKIPLIPFHSWQANVYQKAPTIGTMLLSGIMLKMGLYSVLRWQITLARFTAVEYRSWYVAIGIAGVIYGSILAIRQKNLKKLLAYSSLAHVGLIAAGAYSLTLDGLRGAVLQMLAHGFVVVGLFFAAEIIYRRFETNKISEMGGIRSQAPKFTSMFMILVLASVALPGTFNFVGEFTVLYSFVQVNIWFSIIGGLTIILGAYYMLKMFQNVMLGETNTKVFKDLTFNEGFVFFLIIAVIFCFGMYPKPIIELITPSIENILIQINRTN